MGFMDSGQPSGALAGAGSALPGFLLGGGEMGALMRAHDWSSSPLGSPSGWPQPLRTVVRLMLNTGHPMYIWWGSELACLYNDAYRESIGPERHPTSLGRPAREVWGEIWPIIGPQIEHVMAGRGATWHVDQLVPITRHGRLDEVYWTYSYSPIDDETAAGGIGGVLVVCTETTQQVLAARQLAAERDRLKQLFEQAPIFMALLKGPAHRIELANPGYLQLVGHRPVVGRTVAEALPEAVERGDVALLDRVFESGRPDAATGAKYDVQPVPGGPLAERFVDFVYQPIVDAGGVVTGIFVLGVDVTERTQADALLRESEARFRSALKAGRLGSWETDLATMTRIWSSEAMALFGLDLPGGRGRVGGADDEYVASLHPDDRHLVNGFYELAAAQDSFAAEYRIVRPDGATLYLSGRGLVVERQPDGAPKRLISIMADVTDAKQAAGRLLVERKRLGLALNAGQMGAYDLDIDAGVLWWSPETYALFGVSPATFVVTPESVLELLHPDDRRVFMQVRADAIARREPFVHEFRTRHAEGAPRWLGFRGQAEYDAAGRPVRTFGVVMDITDRKHAEQILRDASREKDNFIATLSHELRNPLAPIRTAIKALRQMAPTDSRVGWCHDVIERQTQQMAHLLDDLLDVSRMSRSQLTLRLQPLLIATVIEHAVEIAHPMVEAAEHRLSVDMSDEPLAVTGDLMRLAQVFSNVLINAAKYTPPRGEIVVTVERKGDSASIRVRDNGIGIAAEHIAQIFEMFGQVESARDRSHGGQGIGLSLARDLAEMHGGTIQARSEGPGKGSEFEIQLPLTPPPAAA